MRAGKRAQPPAWCLLCLVTAVLVAGCVSPPHGGSSGVRPASAPNLSGTVAADPCSFGQMADEGYLSSVADCYYRTHSPLDLLDGLRRYPDSPVVLPPAPGGWITPHDAGLLMLRIDSVEPAAPVVSPVSSYWPFNRTSTVGNEAIFLLEGYRSGRYPPALCSVYGPRPGRAAMRAWWITNRTPVTFGATDAVRVIQGRYPDMRGYPSGSLPPRSIRTERVDKGWYVAFVQEGSGLPILSARCFFIGDDRQIRPSGAVNGSIMVLPQDFSPSRCG